MTHMWNEILEQPVALQRCYEKNRAQLDEIVAVISGMQIDNVVIAARGTSDHAAVYGKYVIEILKGLPVSLAASSVFTMYGKSLRFQNSLVIGISQSGKAADVLEVLKSANENGAVTIGITNYSDSPIAKECRYHLCCEAGLEQSVAATKTFSAQMYLLGLLASLWAQNKDAEKELLTVPGRLSEALEYACDIDQSVARYRFMQECFVLARGVNYAVSMEAALKIQETTYVRAKAFATSDFQHGPIAMIDPDIPVIVFAPEGPSLRDVTDMIARLRSEQIETLVVSNNKDVRDMGTCSIRIPQADNDIISPYFNVVIAQMFSCKLALLKGMDPDKPRRLSKVTITK